MLVSKSTVQSFVYQPFQNAFGAQRILLKPNLGYPKVAPVTASMGVLQAVLIELERLCPATLRRFWLS
jgi:hypothetical protein